MNASSLLISLALLVAVVLPAATGDADSNRIPRWLPHCFQGDRVNSNQNPSIMQGGGLPPVRGIRAVLQCIRGHMDPSCFDESEGESFLDIVDCVNETLPEPSRAVFDGQGNFRRLFHNATLQCLDSYADCVNATIRDRVDQLKPCVRTTLRGLKQCARLNRQECRESCRAVREAQQEEGGRENPFSQVAETELTTCSDIQTELMDPLCEIASCCEPCVEAYVEVMDCVVNDVLEIEEECTLECSAADSGGDTRKLVNRETGVRKLQASSTDGDESICLEFTPGLTGTDAGELEARAEDFLPCMYGEFFETLEAVDSPTMAPEDDEDGSSGSAKFRKTGAAVLTVSTFVLFLSTLFTAF
eukprot:CAMPEP_0117000132 /NCGR_PEP_ID=MMETSP0472-20121206/2585_1 /TAXON_ID=693140 ORGANISM="Tiarina fusus, Strain LIS" /NCGR_SAMPLE_ID=MMETSP0472 /ASSEMBLY_ACC=CAM_ASM_000603 /LENGTH=358 /DNA_ID=CAMNT_0004699741 /DNA_START=54 /DNA_END=1130 /DNA_ORIENTATION=+